VAVWLVTCLWLGAWGVVRVAGQRGAAISNWPRWAKSTSRRWKGQTTIGPGSRPRILRRDNDPRVGAAS